MFLQLFMHNAVKFSFVIGVFAVALHRWRMRSSPPGPRGLPLIGNLFDMPRAYAWLTFTEWKRRYGDLVYLNLCGTEMVIINSAQHALALLDKRGSLYSDRPYLPVACDVLRYSQHLVFAPYGPLFREMRRLFSQHMGSKQSITRFIPLIEKIESRMILALWKDPARACMDPLKHIQRTPGTISLQIAYGYTATSNNDRFVHMMEQVLKEFNMATVPGAFLADTFTFLLWVPEWMPGAGWKRRAIQWRDNLVEACDAPFVWVKEQIAAGTAKPSFTSLHLQKGLNPEREAVLKIAASSVYGAASETTMSAMTSFFLAMLLHPEAQRKAQAEIDSIVGRARMPTYADRENLPYVEALFKEVFRWNPVGPLGFPHCLLQDDEYEGYAFRKGTIFFANVWQFMHDPQTYKDPLTFKPERFLLSAEENTPEIDPRTYAFGFGRRVCPGQHLADAAVYMTCLLALAVFDIAPAEGERAVKLEDIKYTSEMISHAPPFRCSIVSRDAQAERLLGELEISLHNEAT